EDGDAIVHLRPLRCCHQLCDDLVEKSFELGILVSAVVGGENALMLARVRRRILLLWLGQPRCFRECPRRCPGGKQGGAAAREDESKHGEKRRRRPCGAENVALSC